MKLRPRLAADRFGGARLRAHGEPKELAAIITKLVPADLSIRLEDQLVASSAPRALQPVGLDLLRHVDHDGVGFPVVERVGHVGRSIPLQVTEILAVSL